MRLSTHDIIETLPEEIRGKMHELFEIVLEKEIFAIRVDIIDIKIVIKDLAEAQKRTDTSIDKLIEAQKRTDIAIAELTEAQKLTEMRINELTDALKSTNQKLAELTEVVKEGFIATNKRIDKLTEEHEKTREQLGCLSDSFGYSLENKAIKNLPRILRDKYGFSKISPLERKYLKINGEFIEVNVIGTAEKNNKTYTLLGEAKNRINRKNITKFSHHCSKFKEPQFRFFISHILPPPFEEILKKENITFFPSYLIE